MSSVRRTPPLPSPVPSSPSAPTQVGPRSGLLTPLRGSRTFRTLWLAQGGIQMGIWIQIVTAQWILVQWEEPVSVVALVQAASALPVVAFAIPSGVLADLVSRRLVSIIINVVATVLSALLVVLDATAALTTPILFTVLALLGTVQALNHPAWVASVPDVVRREDVADASMLASLLPSIGRVVGPALGGLLISLAGPPYAFIVSALAYAALALAATAVGPYGSIGQRQGFRTALAAGARHARYAPGYPHAIVVGLLWFCATSAFWALLPVLALRTLEMSASQYGIVMAAVGGGAVVGTPLLAPLRRALDQRTLILLMTALFAMTMGLLAFSRTPWLIFLALPLTGVAWVTVGSMLMAHAQQLLPAWVRGRALAFYLVGLQGGMGLGAILWGLVGELIGAPAALAVSGASLVVFVAVLMFRELPSYDDSLSGRPWSQLEPAWTGTAGRVLVIVEYRVHDHDVAPFVAAMREIRRSRLRTGSTRWQLFRDHEDGNLFTEVYLAPSWEDHMGQHSLRQTVADQRAVDLVRSVATQITGSTRHLLEVPLHKTGNGPPGPEHRRRAGSGGAGTVPPAG